jgi:hypothetical protein
MSQERNQVESPCPIFLEYLSMFRMKMPLLPSELEKGRGLFFDPED